jgi:AraC-like DNA-binding protein/ABC-type Fe3+-hydroxamate transport system substrate-binding protein
MFNTDAQGGTRLRKKPHNEHVFSASPLPYAANDGYRRSDLSPSALPPGPGEPTLVEEKPPLVLLRRSIHFKGKWSSTPKRRQINRFTLLYIKQGGGELTINNIKIPIAGPRLLLLLPGMHVVERIDSMADWDVHYIAFKLMRPIRVDGVWSLEAYERFPFPRSGEIAVADMPAIERLVQQLNGDEQADMLGWKRQLALSELLYTLIQEQKALKGDSVPDAVRRCAAYIDRHYGENIRMNKLAEWCGLHPSTFSRHFKLTIGMSPIDYLTFARIEAAKTMLSPAIPLRTVARKVGFCDEYYFSRMFKKTAGVSPSVYSRAAGDQHQGGGRNGIMLEPANIAVTYIDEVDHLIALGLLPAAVPFDHLPDGSEAAIPYLKQYIGHLPHIGCEQSIDKALLRKLSPELIIAGRFMKDWGISGLSDIAPTHYYMWEVDWRNVHRQLAVALGREAHAEQNIAQFDRLVRSARDRMLPACASKTFAFIESTREGVRISPYMSNGGWLLYQQLGFTPAPIVSVNGWEHFAGPEEIASIQADYLFLGQRSGAQDVHEKLLRHPAIKRLGSRLIQLPRYPWGKGGPIAFSQGVKLILSIFAKIHK